MRTWGVWRVGSVNASYTVNSRHVEVVNRCYVFYDSDKNSPTAIYPAENHYVKIKN